MPETLALTDQQQELVEQHIDLVSRVVSRFSVSPETREQLVTEGFFALIRSASRAPTGNFEAYATTSIKNAAYDFLRKFKPQGYGQATDDEESYGIDDVAITHATPEVQAIFNESTLFELPAPEHDLLENIATAAGLDSKEKEVIKDGVLLPDCNDTTKYLRTRAVEKIRRFSRDNLANLSSYEQQFCAEFLDSHKAKRTIMLLEDIRLSIALHKRETGEYPTADAGEIMHGPLKGRRWKSVQQALVHGFNGLKGGSSLSNFIKSQIMEDDILESAELHRQNANTGKYPSANSGEILWGPLKGKKWRDISNALIYGRGGLPGGSSLAQFLEQNGLTTQITPLSILHCADLHYKATGKYPSQKSGIITEGGLKGKTWNAVHVALYEGKVHGYPKKTTLPAFLKTHNRSNTIEAGDIIECLHLEKNNGKYPVATSGKINSGNLKGRTWNAVQIALYEGRVEGYPPKTTLAAFKKINMETLESLGQRPPENTPTEQDSYLTLAM